MAHPATDSDPRSTIPLSDSLRFVMRQVPSPVTVITTAHGEEWRAVTIGSFTSVSLGPPLVSFNLFRTSRTLPVLVASSRFNVHVLRDDQAALALHFAQPELPSALQFTGVEAEADVDGIPVLPERLSLLSCRVRQVYEAGDHVLILGEVERVEGPGEGAPLLYLNRGFHRVGGAIDD